MSVFIYNWADFFIYYYFSLCSIEFGINFRDRIKKSRVSFVGTHARAFKTPNRCRVRTMGGVQKLHPLYLSPYMPPVHDPVLDHQVVKIG